MLLANTSVFYCNSCKPIQFRYLYDTVTLYA